MESTAAAAAFGLGAIGQIGLTVTDIERAITFYRDVLGMKLLFRAPNMGFFACDGIRLMLSGSEKPDEHYGSVIYFRVTDIRQAHETLAARGAAFEGEPHLVARMPDHELWMDFLRDPDRNLLALMSEVPLG
ncbi:MAG TPA: VOC family protein [Bryobacteraceae bacterium]|nr:VOC family protein [Bryobacteraceae bacterium]